MDKEGFRLIEVVTQCPVVFGVYNQMPSGYDQMKWYKENYVRKKDAKERDEPVDPHMLIGEFADHRRKGLVRNFQERVQMLRWMELGKKRD